MANQKGKGYKNVDDTFLKLNKIFHHKTFTQLDLEHCLKFFRILFVPKGIILSFPVVEIDKRKWEVNWVI